MGGAGQGCRLGVFSVAQRNSGVGALLRVELLSRAWAWMLCRRPIARKVAITDEPPYDIRGRVTPVTGMMPRVMPTFTRIWNMSMAAMPPAIRVPNKFLESVKMRSILQISRAYRDSTNAAPMNPKRSPGGARARWVCGAGGRGGSVWVELSPRPVFSPDPIAV